MSLLVVAVLLVGGLLLYWNWWQSRSWPAWERFAQHFVQEDGRVVDRTFGARSTSEGQAYGLFFALVANDRPRFDAILRWTRDNLAGGDFADRLPAWLWGERDDASWGIKDPNPASDADLWLAYTLLEAARLWGGSDYAETGRTILRRVELEEVVTIEPGLMLLPAPQGFRLDGQGWRFNPSYLPEFQFRYLAAANPNGPWREIWDTFERLLPQAAPLGLAPDWFEWWPKAGVRPDQRTGAVGSYDAIRVYLWAGMTPQPAFLPKPLEGFVELLRSAGVPPEQVQVTTRAASGEGPPGFSAAVLPYLHVLKQDSLLEMQRKRLIDNKNDGLVGPGGHYYDQVLVLFGEGWDDGRIRFTEAGRLQTRWDKWCCRAFWL